MIAWDKELHRISLERFLINSLVEGLALVFRVGVFCSIFVESFLDFGSITDFDRENKVLEAFEPKLKFSILVFLK